MNRDITIYPFVDGSNEHAGKREIEISLSEVWERSYAAPLGKLKFERDHDLKRRISGIAALDAVAAIRNPDIYYWCDRGPIGGVEVTTHSPDGSNIEKRYPFIWAARKNQIPAFIATPYLKVRPNGSVNRLPHRYARHNLALLEDWQKRGPEQALQQTIPIASLMGGENSYVEDAIAGHLWDWRTLGNFFAHRLALLIAQGGSSAHSSALEGVLSAGASLLSLGEACMNGARHEEAASLARRGDTWIQTYNARPETGWWERGEGQFDSIDGRAMFTLDSIGLMDQSARPRRFELWLPQMVSGHPWIKEQEDRNYGSKRLRNLAVAIPALETGIEYALRYADHLDDADWVLLEQTPALRLERLVGSADLVRMCDVVPSNYAHAYAKLAARSPQDEEEIERLYRSEKLWVSTARPYDTSSIDDLLARLTGLAEDDLVVVPRVPRSRLGVEHDGVRLLAAEDSTRPLLLALRYLHRAGLVS